MLLPRCFLVVLVLAWALPAAATISGELRQWHRVTLTFDGPAASEQGSPNPFRDYRLNVTFSPNLSLELYAQPFIATGDYENLKELAAVAASGAPVRRVFLADGARLVA